MTKLRFISRNINPNIGFDKSDLNTLQKETGYNFPKSYIQFLSQSGANSNVLDNEVNNIRDLIDLQTDFKKKIHNSELFNQDEEVWCFNKNHRDCLFFHLNSKTNPKVYSFCDSFYTENNGWTEKYGPISRKLDFIEFINLKTEKKIGAPKLKTILSYIIAVITFPIWATFLLCVEIYKRL